MSTKIDLKGTLEVMLPTGRDFTFVPGVLSCHRIANESGAFFLTIRVYTVTFVKYSLKVRSNKSLLFSQNFIGMSCFSRDCRKVAYVI